MVHIHWPGWLLSNLAKLFAWLHNKKTTKPTCFKVKASCYISILEQIATPSSPFWLISSNIGVVGPVSLTSYTFTFPSIPPVTMCKPSFSKANAVTGPWWQRVVASRVDMLGDHMVTDPLLWPNPIAELYGPCTSHHHAPNEFYVVPSFVLCLCLGATILLPYPHTANRKWCGRNSNLSVCSAIQEELYVCANTSSNNVVEKLLEPNF